MEEVSYGGDFVGLHQLIDEQDNRPYIDFQVLGMRMRGLLDSGARRSVIDKRTWDRLSHLGLELTPSKYDQIVLADGTPRRILGEVSLPVTLEGNVKTIDFLVVTKLNSRVILGIDFWLRMRVLPRFKDGHWEFFDSDGSVPLEAVSLVPHSDLSESEQETLRKFQEKWKSESKKTIGCTTLVEHEIDTGDHKPIKQRYYPVSPAIQEVLDKEIEVMLKEGIIEPSKSGWSSPVVLIKKPDKTYRFCVDYRQLNAVTKRDAYPLPYVSHTLDKLRDAKFLSSIDIKSAYWQVPVAEKSRDKTAFTVPNRGLFQFRRMPFGLHNSPATWQRLIDKVLGADLEPYVFVYLDDIIIVTPTFEKHMEVLEEVMRRLQEANLSINWEKSHFCRPELKYLGYIVSREGLHVDPDKVNSILNYPAPKNVKQVRQFLGLASWYRRFVPNFSTIISPLSRLQKKGQVWEWGEEQERAFKLIKDRLISAPILTCPDFTRRFYLQTDASNSGLGAILFQTFDEGDKAVAYASRSLTPLEKKYSTTELECLAVLWSIEKFRAYLEGMPFTVITDHQALKWLNNLKDPQGRLGRWVLKLQQYDFDIQHRPGKQNLAADALSRAYADVEEVSLAEPKDSWYKKMVANVTTNPEKYPDWCIRQGKLFKRNAIRRHSLSEEDPWKLVVPKDERKKVLYEHHDDQLSGHLGTYKTLERLRENYYWPGMASDTARYVTRCQTCLALKPLQQAPGGLMGKQRTVKSPWSVISADLMGPLPLSSNRNRFILVFCDYFTKYSIIVPLKNATAKLVIEATKERVFHRFGVPEVIICDNGSQFRSSEFKDLAAEYQVRLWFTPNYHPQANPVERVNRVIKTVLASYVKENHRKWDDNISAKEFALNTAVHEATGHTPAYLNFGRELRRKGSTFMENEFGPDVPLVSRDKWVRKMKLMESLYCDVQARLKKAYEKGSHTYNLRRRPVTFKEGEIVWRKTRELSDAANYFTSKLAPRFSKCRVKRKMSGLTYELEDFSGKSLGIWHVQDLKPDPGEF